MQLNSCLLHAQHPDARRWLLLLLARTHVCMRRRPPAMAAAGRGRTAACSRVVPLLLLAALFCLLAPQQTAAARSVSIDVDPSTLDLGQDFLHELYYRATGRRLQQVTQAGAVLPHAVCICDVVAPAGAVRAPCTHACSH